MNKNTVCQQNNGKVFDILNFNEEMIDIESIANSLSKICRFNGHLEKFYSVAQHCVLMSEMVSNENRLTALLHDATEAYITDIPKPYKDKMWIEVPYNQFNHLLPEIENIPISEKIYLIKMSDLEKNYIYPIIANRFHCKYPLPTEIQYYDCKLLKYERDNLMFRINDEIWSEWINDINTNDIKSFEIEPWNSNYAKRKFIERFYDLCETKDLPPSNWEYYYHN